MTSCTSCGQPSAIERCRPCSDREVFAAAHAHASACFQPWRRPVHAPGIASVCKPGLLYCGGCGLLWPCPEGEKAQADIGSCDVCDRVLPSDDLYNAAGGGRVCVECR